MNQLNGEIISFISITKQSLALMEKAKMDKKRPGLAFPKDGQVRQELSRNSETKNTLLGFGTVDVAVASDNRDPQFESSR